MNPLSRESETAEVLPIGDYCPQKAERKRFSLLKDCLSLCSDVQRVSDIQTLTYDIAISQRRNRVFHWKKGKQCKLLF